MTFSPGGADRTRQELEPARDAEALAVSVDVSAVPAQPVGAGRYTIDLVAALATRADLQLSLWSRRDDADRWTSPGPGPASPTSSLRVVARAPRSRPFRLAWEQLRLPGLLRDSSVAVHHAPHYTMPERADIACVVTVHDLTFFDHPEWHERTKVVVFRRAINVAARRADALICVSAHTADRLRERCRPTGRVFVVPHGVDHARFRPDDSGRDADILRRLGVHAPYLLFVGTLEPRKAVPVLLDAFDRMAGGRPDVTLVLAGRPGWGVSAVERALGAMRSTARVVRLGYVPDEAVPALLRGAAAAVYPPLEEGFGLPALEAMACGTPLVTTAGTAMAELTGGAAALVTPGAVSELADAMVETLDGGSAVEDRRRRGLAIASEHTWAASAAEHVTAYRWAASHRSPVLRRGDGP